MTSRSRRIRIRSIRAKKLLADAGYPTLSTPPSGASERQRAEPNPKAGAELLAGGSGEDRREGAGEGDRMGRAGSRKPSRAITTCCSWAWAGDNGDPDNYLSPLFSCAAVRSGINFARSLRSDADRLIDEGKASADIGKRTKA